MSSSWTRTAALSVTLLIAGCGAEPAPRTQVDYEARLAW